jgi:hypothetical protein
VAAVDIKRAHDYSSKHRASIMSSKQCGCFYCLATFDPAHILDWVDDDQTALCPQCGIDAVIGTASGFPVVEEKFLRSMREYWFEEEVHPLPLP